jgi:dihydroxyacetone kinase-like predicted kinase
VHAANGREVLVLPNSPNVILAAERAAELSEKPARVVPTTAPQEGLAALLAFDPNAGAERNAHAVGRAAESLRVGGVAPAARDDVQGRFIAGDAVGYAGRELVAWGDPELTLTTTLERIATGTELLTCLAGAGAPLDREHVEAHVPDGVEIEYHEGGQPAWWWLLCAE